MTTEKKLVKAYLDESQWKWAKLQADEVGKSVSEWIGELISQDLNLSVGETSMPVIQVKASIAQEQNFRKPHKSCKHGVAKGDHCWQCGGLAQIE